MSDRRSQPRFDVVGVLWGVLELREEARIRNVSATGALLDSPFPVALDSAQTVRLSIDGQGVAVEARVRHVRPESDGPMDLRYVIGVEFISPPLSVLQSIEQMSGGAPSDAESEIS
jgi:PilZ domain-containing protein